MTTQPQPEALRLADWCEANSSGVYRTSAEAATELRRLHAECEAVKKELETERVRLAACGVIAMSNTPESAARARYMLPMYRSASADDVANAVDREMALRGECKALRADAERYRLLCEVHGPSTELCFDGRSYRGKAEFDAAIDAYRAAKEQSNG